MRSWVSSRPRRSRDDRDLLRADGVVETELTRRGLTRKLGDRVLFARVGWMAYYRGEQLEPIIGGGDWDEKHEVCNFVDIGGRLYGFARPTGGTISLQRIVPGHRDATLDRVLVIFFATHPDKRGQVIVGWYSDATVHRFEQRPSARIARRRDGLRYFFEADRANACLLPREARMHVIPREKGATGYSMISYARDERGVARDARWIRDAIAFVRSYRGDNVLDLDDPAGGEATADATVTALAAEDQGPVLDPADRRLIEAYAVARARAYFETTHHIEERGRPYDLRGTPKKGRGAPLFIEVKGTQGLGERVILTENEVRHATDHQAQTTLFLVHSIELVGRGKKRRARGGEIRVLSRWRPSLSSLTPIAYYYELP